MLSIQFVIYTFVLSIFPLGVFTLLICQILADKYGKHKINDNVQKVLLYSVYISALICSCFGYSLHISKDHPRWCQIFGLPPCFAVLGATKAFLYGFFLRRARKANAYNINGNRCAVFLFDYIGPIYIFIYWLCYVAFAALYFSGKVTDKEEHQIISYCLFESWRWWFVIFSNTVDVFNCVVTLILFILPLLHSLKRLRINNDNVNHTLSHKFIRTLRWNVALSFIATISSVSLLVCIPVVKEYIWLFCGGDPFINSLCVFMMMASNRTFIKYYCCTKCGHGTSSRMVLQSKIAVIEPHHDKQKSINIVIQTDNVSAETDINEETAKVHKCVWQTFETQSPNGPHLSVAHSTRLPVRQANKEVPPLALYLHHSY
eukprot:10973_1